MLLGSRLIRSWDLSHFQRYREYVIRQMSVLLLVKINPIVDDTGPNARDSSVATNLGSGVVRKIAQLDYLSSRKNLLVATKNTASPNVFTRPVKVCVWVLGQSCDHQSEIPGFRDSRTRHT